MNHSSLIPKNRLEAFSDGVLAIIITIMVLELKIPQSDELSALRPVLPVFLSYILSFIYLGIYWNNHHHLLHAAKQINGKMMWANLHLLFWLSLIPFFTGWLGESRGGVWPTGLYGAVLLMAGFAYKILQTLIVESLGKNSALAVALGSDWKGNCSLGLYVVAIALAFIYPVLSYPIYIGVALMWIIPDRRIEKLRH